MTSRIFVFDFILMFIRCKQRECICLTDVHMALDEIALNTKKIRAIFEKNYSKWVYGILSVSHFPNSRRKKLYCLFNDSNNCFMLKGFQMWVFGRLKSTCKKWIMHSTSNKWRRMKKLTSWFTSSNFKLLN